jgi:hypothetical protein
MYSLPRIISAVSLLVILASCRSFGTQLVMVIVKNRVVLAADSRVTDDSGRRLPDMCKIQQSGTDNYFYAVSGLRSDPNTGFDSDQLFAKRRKIIRGAKSLNEIGDSFVPLLQKELALIKYEAPYRYNEFVYFGNMDSLFVIDMHGKTPEGFIKDLDISSGQVVSIPARTCLGDLEECTLASSVKVLAPFFRNNPDLPRDKDNVVSTVNRIMQAAVNIRPTEVGPPFSILALEPTGPRWLVPGLCGEIRKSGLVKKKAQRQK